MASLAVLATAAALLAIPNYFAHAAPPPNPSDSQIQSAKQQKDSLAGQVGALGAQVATLQTQLHQLNAQEELAEQKVALAVSELQDAKQAASTAKHNAELATQQVKQAQQEFVAYAQAQYMSGELPGTTGTLLTADDPNVLLQQGELERYQSVHRLGAVGDIQRAKVAKSNADTAARAAVQKQAEATAAAKKAEQQAVAAVQAAKQQQKQVAQALAASQTKLSAAQSRLATLNGQRATYNAYVAEQKRLAEKRRQEQLARERAAEQAAAAAARARQNQQSSSSGGGGGGGGYSNSPAPSPSGGSWSAARGRNAVNRAEQWLGTMYAWAGGNASGPTYGVCAGDGAWNDCHVRGFDCSGLVMYAWGPYISLTHYAATQYTQAGSYHPSSANFKPGDLLFWSSNGRISGIHHVAIYIGNGNVIQAPQSGSRIQITPWDQVTWGYFGATRPLT